MIDFLQVLLLYVAIGAAAGLLAGLLGVGGGLIIVPAMAWSFQIQNVSDEVMMHLAIGTSLATIVLTSISSVREHHRHGAVQWPVFWRLTPGIVIGALLGSVVADAMKSRTLEIVFGIFVLVMAAQLAFGARPPPQRELPGTVGMGIMAVIIGVISAIVGIGGGSLTVPFLTWCNVKMRQAVATSAACGFPIAVGGATGYVAMGWDEPARPAWSIGYVYGPALLGIALTSVFFAPLGARLAHRIPSGTLRRVFAVFLTVVGITMLMD